MVGTSAVGMASCATNAPMPQASAIRAPADAGYGATMIARRISAV